MGKAERNDAALELAELAHELHQPLTGIRTSAELLLESHANDPAVRSRAAAIVQQVQRIQLLVERARRSGPPPPDSQGVALERNLASQVPAVKADQLALEQIFGNLLRNALEATAGKRGRIRVSTALVGGAVEAVILDDGLYRS